MGAERLRALAHRCAGAAPPATVFPPWNIAERLRALANCCAAPPPPTVFLPGNIAERLRPLGTQDMWRARGCKSPTALEKGPVAKARAFP